ncbi:MAG: alginate lyase family protein [Geminicoccaceae bacterium]
MDRLRALPRPDSASEPFALAVMTDAAAGLAGDPWANRDLVELLDHWATARALMGTVRPTANISYALDRTLLPTIVAFSLVREDPGIDRVKVDRIEAWLKSVLKLRRSPGTGEVTAHNNHHLLRASVDMAWGALTNDTTDFEHGIAAYVDALRRMRADGSLPLETARGARALWYQRHAVASLVVIAQMGAVQGIDLFGLQISGRNLHLAISFLLDGIEQPERVWPYAAANDNPGVERSYRDQDLGFVEARGHDRHYMAWAEIYLARFPDRTESRRLLAVLKAADPDFRPMLDEYSGGNTTCYFAQR